MSYDRQLAIKQSLLKKQPILESRLKLHNIERNFEDYANDICYSVSQKQELSECSPESIVDAALQVAKVGLYIGGNVAHLVPLKDKCTFQIGYQGYTMLLGRVIQIKNPLYYDVVYSDDDFTYDQTEEVNADGLKCVGTLKRKRGKSQEIKGAFCFTSLVDGNSFVLYMDKAEIDRYKSRASSGHFWGKWDNTMYAKQVLRIQHRQLLKWYAPSQSQKILDITSDDETAEMKMAVAVKGKTRDLMTEFAINPSEISSEPLPLVNLVETDTVAENNPFNS